MQKVVFNLVPAFFCLFVCFQLFPLWSLWSVCVSDCLTVWLLELWAEVMMNSDVFWYKITFYFVWGQLCIGSCHSLTGRMSLLADYFVVKINTAAKFGWIFYLYFKVVGRRSRLLLWLLKNQSSPSHLPQKRQISLQQSASTNSLIHRTVSCCSVPNTSEGPGAKLCGTEKPSGLQRPTDGEEEHSHQFPCRLQSKAGFEYWAPPAKLHQQYSILADTFLY